MDEMAETHAKEIEREHAVLVEEVTALREEKSRKVRQVFLNAPFLVGRVTDTSCLSHYLSLFLSLSLFSFSLVVL